MKRWHQARRRSVIGVTLKRSEHSAANKLVKVCNVLLILKASATHALHTLTLVLTTTQLGENSQAGLLLWRKTRQHKTHISEVEVEGGARHT